MHITLKQKEFDTSKNESRHPKGYWMGIGMSIGIAIGAGLGPIFDNFGVGIGIGVAIGAGIGTALEQRNKDSLRPLTEQEEKKQKRTITIGALVATVLAVFLIIVYILQSG
jgi:preprotein translocase subunit SecY